MRRVIGLILIGLGTCSVAFAALLSLYIAPTLIAAPATPGEITTLRAGNATYFDAKKGQTTTGATVTATNTVKGDKKAATDTIAVYDSFTAVEDVAARYGIDYTTQRVAFDRHSSQQISCCKAGVDGDTTIKPAGIGIVWPIGVDKKTYQVFDASTKQAWPATFAGTDKVHGLTAYKFVQHIPDTKVGTEPSVPGNLLGLPKKSGIVTADRYYKADVTFWIDPQTGTLVNQEQQVHSELRTTSGGMLVAADLDLKMVDASQKHLVSTATSSGQQIMLLRTAGPLFAGGLGLIFVVLGVVAVGRRPSGQRRITA